MSRHCRLLNLRQLAALSPTGSYSIFSSYDRIVMPIAIDIAACSHAEAESIVRIPTIENPVRYTVHRLPSMEKADLGTP